MELPSSCIHTVGGIRCPFCKAAKVIRYGKNGMQQQRYKCKDCNKYFLNRYIRNAYHFHTNDAIVCLLKEGCGIRSISRLLKIAVSTVLRKILQMAKKIRRPMISTCKEYELDELCTYVKCKTRKRWVVYAIRKDTQEVIDFTVGSRTNNTLKRVTDTLVLSNADKVYTDKLPNYGWLLPESIHCTKRNGTNHIERMNLNLRTHLKRLSRRTICFSKSMGMLIACLRIYFWG